MDLRSWCLADDNRGSECGWLKSPMRFECCSDVDSAWWMTASEWQRTRLRLADQLWPELLTSRELLVSVHSLARFTDCFEDVGVSRPSKHDGDVAWCTDVWSADDKFSLWTLSVTPRRRLRHETVFLSATGDFVTGQCVSRSEPELLNSAKPTSSSGTGDNNDDSTLYLVWNDLCTASSSLYNIQHSADSITVGTRLVENVSELYYSRQIFKNKNAT